MKMIKLIVLIAAMVAVTSTLTLAGDYSQGSTTGFTSISKLLIDNYSVKSATDILEYNWFLTNNTGTSASPVSWNVLVWSLQPFNVPVYSSTPYALMADGITADASWKWKTGGWDSYTVASNEKYSTPPAIAPGETKKFVYKFQRQYLGTIDENTDTNEIGSNMGFTAHIAAVVWNSNKQKWEAAPSSTYSSVSNSQTWFDKPNISDIDPHDEDPNEPVPEASPMVLGAIGLLGPLGVTIFRRKS